MLSQRRSIAALTNLALLSAWAGALLYTIPRAAGGEQGGQPRSLRITTTPGQALKAEERKQVLEAVHTVLKVPEARRNQVTLINARSLLVDEKEGIQANTIRTLVWDHARGKALRLDLDSQTGKLLKEDVLDGRPQPGPEEISEVKQIVQKDPEHAKLLKAGGALEGGFLSDPPKEVAPAKKVPHRIIQMHLLTRDRSKLERVVYVDLTDRKIVSSKPEN